MNKTQDILLVTLLIFNIIYLITLILPFTLLAKKQVKNNSLFIKKNSIKLLVSNVLQSNNETELCKNVIKNFNPDIVLLVETDAKWQKEMESLKEIYPFYVHHPLENTYGLLLFSKFKLENTEVMFLISDEIPSIKTEVILANNQRIMLYCLHPEPPVPQESKDSLKRDAEILIVGKMAKLCKLPVVVCGDLNDVAWSHTTNLFSVNSKLLDPRKGRGLFNTYNSKYLLLRWPLDHFFCSDHFTLHAINRLPSIGSDHFPISVTLCLNDKNSLDNEVESSSKEQMKEVNEKIQEGLEESESL